MLPDTWLCPQIQAVLLCKHCSLTQVLTLASLSALLLQLSYYTSKSKQEEIDSHHTDGFPLFLITYACAITLSVISCLR